MCSSKNDSKMTETPKSARRSNKPLMERRRRERINHCLNELKNLVLTAQRKDPTRYSKLEKADILEMTVRHVRSLHRQDAPTSAFHPQGSPPPTASEATAKYRAGFSKCASEVSRFLAGVNGLPSDLHARVLSHLNAATNTEYTANRISSPVIPPPSPAIKTEPVPMTPKISPKKQQQLSVMAGMPVVEAKLKSGELALVAPSWAGVSVSGSPPTNATSPEAAGAPSSPESARGSPTMYPGAEESNSFHYCPSTTNTSLHYPAHSLVERSSSSITKCTYSTTTVTTGKMQVDLQVAPLDLATSHRRLAPATTSINLKQPTMRQRATTVSVETLPRLLPLDKANHLPKPAGLPEGKEPQRSIAPSAPNTAGFHQPLKEFRHAPYPAHQHHQHPHWRPW